MGVLPFRAAGQAPLNNSKFVEILSAVSGDGKLRWRSKSLFNRRVNSLDRLHKVIRDSIYRDIPRDEILSFVNENGGIRSSSLWNIYFESYDRVVAFSPGYIRLIEDSCRWLPSTGTILDLGAGTGNFSLGAALSGERQQILAIDQSLTGLRLAQKKLRMADRGGNISLGLYNADLRQLRNLRLPIGIASGAVLNNVLYSLAPRERTKLLDSVSWKLAPGAILVLNDPTPGIQTSKAELKEFIWTVASEALSNESPATEFDYALVAYLNDAALTNGSATFLTPEALRSMAQKSGFEVIDDRSAYYGYTTFLVAQEKRVNSPSVSLRGPYFFNRL